MNKDKKKKNSYLKRLAILEKINTFITELFSLLLPFITECANKIIIIISSTLSASN